MARGLEILPVEGVREVRPGDDLATLLADAAPYLADGDVLVVTQKVVSKAEAQLVPIDPNDPGKARIVDAESVAALRRRGDLAGQRDPARLRAPTPASTCRTSRTGWAALLPRTPTGPPAGCATAAPGRARRRRDQRHLRAVWRRGLADVAIGCAGIRPRRRPAGHGRRPRAGGHRGAWSTSSPAPPTWSWASRAAFARPSSGADPAWRLGEVGREVVRPAHEDLFR